MTRDGFAAMTQIGAGMYADRDGALHFDLGEMLVALRTLDTPENRDALRCIVLAQVRAVFPDVELVDVDEP